MTVDYAKIRERFIAKDDYLQKMQVILSNSITFSV